MAAQIANPHTASRSPSGLRQAHRPNRNAPVSVAYAEHAVGTAFGPEHARAVVAHLGKVRSVESELVGVVLFEDEDAVAGDADRNDPETLTVECPQHPSRRDGADRVLAGATAKQHRHRRLCHSASSRPGVRRHPL